MRFFAFLIWTVIRLITVAANPLPLDMLYNDFYSPDSQVTGDSLFGEMASTNPSSGDVLMDDPNLQMADDTGNLWTSASGNENYDLLPQDVSQPSIWTQDLTMPEDPQMWACSCGGAEVQKRGEMRVRDDAVCPSGNAPLNFKLPTLPKYPTQTEVKPTLGRLRFLPPAGVQDPLCSVEPYEHHLCCDGPVGDEAMDFGDLQVYTPVKNCRPGN